MSGHSNKTVPPERTPDEPAPVAYSFTRFSDPKQSKGDSLRRQTAETVDWCERNGIPLDTSLKLHHVGSAYRGKHRSDKYALGEFLKLATRGRIPKGSYLVIENLDRLSREEERPALRLWMDILDAGINIVQLIPETIFRHEKSDMVDVMRAIIELSRGHSESRIKSERLTEMWAQRKRRARENGEIVTHALPGWVEDRSGKLTVSAQHKTTIKRIFRLASRGYGCARIIRKLKEEGRPTFGRSGRWTTAYLIELLKDRRLLGEYQPLIRATGEPDGHPVPNYFPAVLTEAEFFAGHRKASVRKSLRKDIAPVNLKDVGELHQQGKTVSEIARALVATRQQIYRALVKLGRWEIPAEPTPRKLYLFAGMVRAIWGRRPYRLQTDPGGGRQVKILTLEDRSQSFPYYVFERAVLSQLAEVNPREILDGANGHDEVIALEGELGAVEAKIADLEGELLTGDVKAISRVLRQLEARQQELDRQLAAAKQKAANPLSAAWGETKTLLSTLDSAADPEDAAVRLRAALRRIIAGIGMGVLKIGRERRAFVEIEFTGEHENRFRFYTVWYRPRTGNHRKKYPGGWAVVSVAGEGPPIRREPSEEPEGDSILHPSDWIQSLPAEPDEWHSLPD